MEPRHNHDEPIEELLLEEVQETILQAQQFEGELPDPFDEVLGG